MGVSLFGRVGQVMFAACLAAGMVTAAGWMKLVHLLPSLKKSMREGLCLMLVQFAWRWAVVFSPWIRVSLEKGSSEWADVVKGLEMEDGKSERPLFIIANHTSFFDTLFTVIKFPQSVLWRCRTYMKDDLFKLPVLGTICRCVGHFPVYFKSGEEGSFKVDAERMEAVEKDVDAHLKDGGWLCFFPEGAINKTPDKLLPLRYGGFKKALEFDAKLVSMVSCGCPKVWPMKAAVGGFPGQIKYSVKILAPDGARALAAELRKKALDEATSPQDAEKVPADQVLIANAIQGMMQQQYDDLKASLAGERVLKDLKASLEKED